jgi:hypothetical protein
LHCTALFTPAGKGEAVNLVELRLRVTLATGWVEFSQTVLLSGTPVAGHIIYLDPHLGSAAGMRVNKAGWLALRGWVCWVEDESYAPITLAGDPVALVRHYLARGWVITGSS